MKFDPLFPKKKKKDIDQQIMETGVMLSNLEDKFRIVIGREIRVLRNNRNDKRAQEKVKNALFSLQVVRNAQEQLNDIDTTHALNQAMNNLGLALKSLNGISFRSENVNSFRLQRGMDKMDKNAEKRGGGIGNFFKQDINELIDDSTIERLVAGESVDSCLNGSEISNLTEDSFAITEDDLNQVNFEQNVDHGEAENGADMLEELMKHMD